MTTFTYSVFGLKLASSFPLPELKEQKDIEPDVEIRFGKVPELLESTSENGLLWQSEPGKLLLSIENTARYLVIDDREIIIEPAPESSESKIRTFLLGSIMASILYARNTPILHASVINTKRGAVLFMGRSGAGKSTMLGAFLKRGYEMLSDDKAGIFIDEEGEVKVLSAFPAARLMKKTVSELGYTVDDTWVSQGKRKYVMPVKNFVDEPVRIYAAYSIKPYNKEEIVLTPLEQFDRFQHLNRNTYRRRFIQEKDQKKKHLGIFGKMAEQIRVIEVLRPNNPQMIGELADKIEEDFNE
jgi:hypothetical protein